MSDAFELAKRMLYSGERLTAPLQYLMLFSRLTMAQQYFLHQESESIHLAPDPEKEGRRRLTGRQREPGGGRKRLGTRPDYVAALERVLELQTPASSLAYSLQSARSIAVALKQEGFSCSPTSVPRLLDSAGLRVHPRIKASPRVKPVEPARQFEFIGRRLDHVLSKATGAALYVTADPLPKAPCNCPTDRLDSWRGQALAARLQGFLHEREGDFAAQNTCELLLLVEAGGLLGLRNKNLQRTLQLFATRSGMAVYLSHLPPGLSRMSVDVLSSEAISLARDQWKLGTIQLRIGSVKASSPPSRPQDGNFRPTSWNRIIRPIFPFAQSHDTQATTSCNNIQDAAAEDGRPRRESAG